MITNISFCGEFPDDVRELVRAATRFYDKHCNPTRAPYRVKFTLDDVEDGIAETGWAKVGCITYRITVDPQYADMPVNNFLDTVFHELTHVRQMIDGRLRHSEDGEQFIWDGVVYDSDVYWLAPWEVEANGTAVGCMAMFCLAHPEFVVRPPRTPKRGRTKRNKHATVRSNPDRVRDSS